MFTIMFPLTGSNIKLLDQPSQGPNFNLKGNW